MSITHVTPREMELQAEVDRLKAELEAAKADIERYVRIASEQEAKLAALEAPSRIGGWASLDGCR